MIVVDSSALIAIVLNEPEREAFEAIVIVERGVMSAVNVHESACVLRARLGEDGVALMWRLMAEFEIEIAPFDAAQARAAIAAYGRFGKGVDPKARLNLADCAAYALAKTLDYPLLFKGADFSATYVRACRL
ncbi:type II toxin-antitoxin system VapC family toxin [Methylocystis sp.]|jgi:ribonuclease VapC|uniref:type II toxin-antitoxin system VapC family toxin n=1 Tax=Methylocystis sp. TaxID=1911079 RepID=UPI002732756C|nr:type II toxin-antitoxin system VapC family toxin [Methylocystis sp.]MDP3555167.1 type II toxin-antitoxin system VapC family toxin [Methylocystis sp.]